MWEKERSKENWLGVAVGVGVVLGVELVDPLGEGVVVAVEDEDELGEAVDDELGEQDEDGVEDGVDVALGDELGKMLSRGRTGREGGQGSGTWL